MCSTPSLTLLSGTLCSEVIVPVWLPLIGQIELFNHLIYLKPFNSAQTNDQR